MAWIPTSEEVRLAQNPNHKSMRAVSQQCQFKHCWQDCVPLHISPLSLMAQSEATRVAAGLSCPVTDSAHQLSQCVLLYLLGSARALRQAGWKARQMPAFEKGTAQNGERFPFSSWSLCPRPNTKLALGHYINWYYKFRWCTRECLILYDWSHSQEQFRHSVCHMRLLPQGLPLQMHYYKAPQ